VGDVEVWKGTRKSGRGTLAFPEMFHMQQRKRFPQRVGILEQQNGKKWPPALPPPEETQERLVKLEAVYSERLTLKKE